jgi:hypothetical protein
MHATGLPMCINVCVCMYVCMYARYRPADVFTCLYVCACADQRSTSKDYYLPCISSLPMYVCVCVSHMHTYHKPRPTHVFVRVRISHAHIPQTKAEISMLLSQKQRTACKDSDFPRICVSFAWHFQEAFLHVDDNGALNSREGRLFALRNGSEYHAYGA